MTPGTKVGTYEIFAPIGRGRHGRNAPRQEQSLRREVAIKMLEPPSRRTLGALPKAIHLDE